MKTYSGPTFCSFIVLIVSCISLLGATIASIVYFSKDLHNYSKKFWIKCAEFDNLPILSIAGVACAALSILILLLIILLFMKQKFNCIFPFVVIIAILILGTTASSVLEYIFTDESEKTKEFEKFEKNLEKQDCLNELYNEFNCKDDKTTCISNLTQFINDKYEKTNSESFRMLIVYAILDALALLSILILFCECPCGRLHELNKTD